VDRRIGTTHQLETMLTTPNDDAVQVKRNAISGWLDNEKREGKGREGKKASKVNKSHPGSRKLG
jgi:hypothetical protein